MRLIDADELSNRLMNRWETADQNKEKLVRHLMVEVVTPIVVGTPTVQAVPIPDNATNGDVLKAFFSNINRDYDVKHKMGQILFTHEWWNMPYEGSDTE